MFEVTSLGSGSSGNALLIRTPETTVLVDCGVSIRRMSRAFSSHGVGFADIDAVLVTHEHGDHVRELPRFMNSRTPIICTRGSSLAVLAPRKSWQECRVGNPVQLADLEIIAIPVAHDAADPCGFLIRSESATLTVLTDLGSAAPAANEAIAESHLVVLEANHDEGLLRRGPYPAYLQRRILSDSGHLSNGDCGELLANALRGSSRLPTVWLAHLSQTNNRPVLAKQTVARRLARAGLQLDLHALPRHEASASWNPGVARSGTVQLSLDL